MNLPFVDRDLTENEVDQLRLGLSTFLDGSGWERDDEGNTLPGWRQMERVVAEVLQGTAQENKGVFDVILREGKRAVGVSVKSKTLERATALEDLDSSGRLYLEVANSPALFWHSLEAQELTQEMFRNGFDAQDMGDAVLATVHDWHAEFKSSFEAANKGITFDLDASVHLVISANNKNSVRRYQIHAVPLQFPDGIKWSYRQPQPNAKAAGCKSILGRDPITGEGVLVDWYPFSGGQLKYYPRAKGLKCTNIFSLEPVPNKASILDRARAYWPHLLKDKP